ncbi:hypothetical protein KY309_01080 [Candidatus Woesearchaeota archaeon]|nr:hypothetical protein [Candidatus Woesearchaeota archaeon]MBW3016187.1 hypothetical protein [Candidatus Woesearchaeota archaeon]
MKINVFAWLVILVFAAIIGVGLLGGSVTGQAAGGFIPVTSGTILSVIAAILCIGVLVVAALRQNKK